MANRHLQRSLALQTLFEWDFRGKPAEDLLMLFRRVCAEFAPEVDDLALARSITEGVAKNLSTIDPIITKIAPEWPIEQIAPVDRAILRIGVYELTHGDYAGVPPKVAINEAVVLAKSFGTNSTPRFVNGVLGTLYKELGEPMKSDHTGRTDHPQISEKHTGKPAGEVTEE
jgi:N utilization substance protein B